MEQSPPSPPRTILVVDDRPSDVSFICSVLDAHALPYMVQVIDPSDPAFDSFDHLTQNESRRVPTLILHRTRPQQAGQVLWRRLIALWPAVTLPRVLRRVPQHTAAPTVATPPGLGCRPRAPRRPRVGYAVPVAGRSAAARPHQSTGTQRPHGRGTLRGSSAGSPAC